MSSFRGAQTNAAHDMVLEEIAVNEHYARLTTENSLSNLSSNSHPRHSQITTSAPFGGGIQKHEPSRMLNAAVPLTTGPPGLGKGIEIWGPLCESVIEGDIDKLRKLSKQISDLNCPAPHCLIDRNILHIAAGNQQRGATAVILRSSTDPNVRLLDFACAGLDFAQLGRIAYQKSRWGHCDKGGRTALHHAVIPWNRMKKKVGYEKLEKQLVENHYEIKKKSSNPLWKLKKTLSRSKSIPEVVEKQLSLLSENLKDDAQDDKKTDVMVMNEKKAKKSSKQESEWHARRKGTGDMSKSLYSESEQQNAIAIIALLLEAGADPTIVDAEGQSPLHYAVSENQIYIVKALMVSQKCVIAPDNLNRTPLHLCGWTGNVAIAKALLGDKVLAEDSKAALNSQNKVGRTPAHVAAVYGHIDVAKVFVEYGTDLHALNNLGQTPAETGVDSGFEQFAIDLVGLGAPVTK
eukprot:UC4_evm1s363